MALFQNTVISKYLKTQNPEVLSEKWKLFTSHFHDPSIQENIRNSKEEQYQEGFLRDLFVKVLGYTLNPNPDFNLTTEYKNVKDAKKADGAVIIDDNVPAVIELKGTDTTDLGTVEDQAFGYKNNQPTCKYVIISNFEKLRFYIDNAIEHIEFNLFKLTEDEFKLLYLCLSYENIKNDIASKIKNESLSREDEITKQLYKDYSVFKRELFQNLIEENPEYNQVELFKKSQKLLDRLLFLFFGEDRGLLPPNSVRMILDQWNKLKDLDEYVPLYDRFKKYFGYLNTGFKGKQYDVFAYNGGLFEPDEILDNTKIDDNLLYTHSLKLSDYDFESEVDVNILGHIFEHSLNEIDEIKAQLEGEEIDKTKTKRKKDGVFYTPKYITKYIVENTVGKLCEEEKTNLGIKEEDYYTDKKRQLKTKQVLLKKLQDYRIWLHQITIIDPACGSGSFLIEALNFLIEEHSHIDEMEAKLTDSAIAFSYHPESILEHNLYGVDINEESVEIAKLSLWLRTAEPNRKLSSLNDNLKCGNSLIDDPEVAGKLAFHWEKEFPKVFEKGGFDVVIGNPPYLRVQGLKDNFYEQTLYFEKNFKSAVGNYDIYVLFIELSLKLINDNGVASFILPHKFLISEFGEGIRNELLKNRNLYSILHFEEHLVFEVTTYTCIISLDRKEKDDVLFKHINPLKINEKIIWNAISYLELSKKPWNLKLSYYRKIFDKLNNNKSKLEDYINVFSGIQTSGDKIYILRGAISNNIFRGYSEELNQEFEIESEIVKPIIKGFDIKRYSSLSTNNYVIFPYEIVNGNPIFIEEDTMKIKYPNCFNYLKLNEQKLRSREKNKMNHSRWYSYVYPKNLVLSNLRKLVSPDITMGLNITKDNHPYCLKNGAYGIQVYDEFIKYEDFLFCILNSNLLWFFLKNTGNVLRGGYFRFNTKYINPFPIPNLNNDLSEFSEFSDQMLSLSKELQELSNKFQRMLEREFELESLSKKLQDWYNLSFAEFLKELEKQKIKLSLTQKSEWEDYFTKEQTKALSIQSEINATDKEIDQMVYQLYGLTEEEIEVVEKG
ncbi:MAG: N-6 DNA methylase [Moheibacter sp.]